MRVLLLFLILWIIPLQGFSQACKDFHKSNDCYVYVPLDRDYQQYNQAKSVSTDIGRPNVYKVVLFGNRDYIVGVCAGEKYYRQIHFRIIDSQTQKPLYDNKDYDYIESFSFTVEKTQALDLEVTILSKEKTAPTTKVCLGLQILWSKIAEKK